MSGLLALVLLGGACARPNSAYGEEQQATDSNSGSGSVTSESTDPTNASHSGSAESTTASAESSEASGPPTPQYACEEPGFHIEITNAPACPFEFADTIQCVQLSDWGGNRLRGSRAEGCAQGSCISLTDTNFEVGVDGLDLPSLFPPEVRRESVCAWIRLGGAPSKGACTFDRLAVFGIDGYLHLALGNGPPDADPMLPRPLTGNATPITSTFHAETGCGDLAPCDRSGYRSIIVGKGVDAALPDGVPAPALLPMFAGQDDVASHSVFNWGLQYDLSCEAWGRWAVVPTAHESLFD